MTGLMTAALVFVGGGIGAALRHFVGESMPTRLRSSFPWAIMMVNVVGSFGMGCVVVIAAAEPNVLALVGTGFFGGLTTFSTASLDTVKLLLGKRWLPALANSLGMLILCVVVALAGVLCSLAALDVQFAPQMMD